MKRRFLTGLWIMTFLWLALSGLSQENQPLPEEEETPPGKVVLHAGADLVSRYVWRGLDFGNSPAIQPSLSLDAFGFSLGAWGSYGFSRFTHWVNDSTPLDYNFTELDLFVSYRYRYFTLVLTDYYAPVPIDTLPGINYFHWKKQTTWHTLEATLLIEGPERFPIQLLAATLIYGADKGKDSAGVYGAGTRNNYSTYLELSYTFGVKGFTIRPFLGGIPFGSSWYGPRAGINNAGISVRKEIPVSRKFTIPVQANLVVNSLSKKAYLVFIVSL